MYLRFHHNTTEGNREAYKEGRNQAKQVVRETHKRLWERFVSTIEDNTHGQVVAYKVLKSLSSFVR